MSTGKETAPNIIDELRDALKAVEEAKAKKDAAVTAATDASDRHEEAVLKAQAIHDQFQSSVIASVLPKK